MKLEQVNRAPLHRQIAAVLKSELQKKHKPGDKLPPESQMAKDFQVSLLTIREALCVLSEEGMVSRMRGRGTFVLDPKERQHIAIYSELDVLLPGISYYFHRLIQQLKLYFEKTGKRTQVYLGKSGPGEFHKKSTCESLLTDIENDKICGIIGVNLPFGQDFKRRCAEKKIPLIACNPHYDYCVYHSNTSLIKRGLDYLVARGASRIGMIYFGSKDPNAEKEDDIPSDRDIFITEMARHGLAIEEKWLIPSIPLIAPGAGWESFRELWFAKEEKPDGLLICDDILFQEAMVAICEMGLKVPEELTICTHANKGGFTLYPFPVAKIEFDADKQAQVMGDMLAATLRDETIPNSKIVLQDTLVETPSAAEAAASLRQPAHS